MSYDIGQGNQSNPYQSDLRESNFSTSFNKVKVQAPAIALMVFGSLCLVASIFGTVNALIAAPPVMPADSPEWAVQLTKNSVGPLAAGIQSVFIAVALFILFGAVQMLRLKMWGVAMAASIVSMLNFGSCCCIVGLPLGIWALVVLLMADVKQAFAMNAGM